MNTKLDNPNTLFSESNNENVVNEIEIVDENELKYVSGGGVALFGSTYTQTHISGN
ncbi:MAG: hypothetical protein H6937_07835 [Burkholderiales bacterium]|nr:hypothetical protein [Burkholderiales bacterium]MDR4516981.1 hypothetical protein [Nitrosomonas sp.]